MPADPITENYLRQVSGAVYSHVNPTQASQPTLVSYSKDCADLLGLDAGTCDSVDFVETFAGNHIMNGMKPYAMCYGGHQFGSWAGQLGDGRAITLGEVRSDAGRFALQLKGAGKTPYSRSADGLAVLRSSLREYVCSEAMHYLGVPTTRALSLILTGDEVLRDMLYDGHPAYEPGAVVCRVAPTFIRFGNFEILTARRELDLLRQLADFTIDQYFPNISKVNGKERYAVFFDAVCSSTAAMVCKWMQVGFVHGVMNTDNMSILGLTIDYGPYGWLEDFDPDWTPNTTDASTRRYRYGQQPNVAKWNLLQLANSLYPLIEDAAPLQAALDEYTRTYENLWRECLLGKLGLNDVVSHIGDEFLNAFEGCLRLHEIDITLFFRYLAKVNISKTPKDGYLSSIAPAFYAIDGLTREHRERWNKFLDEYAQLCRRSTRTTEQRAELMNSLNPLYVPRNYLAQLAIDQVEKGNYDYLADWMETLKRPYTPQLGKEAFAGKRPEWARTRVGCSMLSCSS